MKIEGHSRQREQPGQRLVCLGNSKEARVAGAEGARGREGGEGHLEAMGRTEFNTGTSRESWECLD